MDYYIYVVKSLLFTILGSLLLQLTDEVKYFDSYQCVHHRFWAKTYGFITVILGLYHLIPIIEQFIAISTILIYLQLWLSYFKYEECGQLKEIVNVYTFTPLIPIAVYVLLQHHKEKSLFAIKRATLSK